VIDEREAAPGISMGARPNRQAATTEPPLDNRDYLELRQIIQQHGLLERQPAYYAFKIVSTLGMMAASLFILLTVRDPWLQSLNAVFLAFVSTQVGLTGHDIGHKQVFRARWLNALFGLLFGNLLIGVSRQWWIDKHNLHHSHPNELDVDPDIDIPLLAFSEEEALSKRGLTRWIVTHQARLVWFLMTLQALALHADSVRFVAVGRAKHRLAEAVCLLAYVAVFVGGPLLLLGPGLGTLFVLVHQGLFGLYMSSIFAPNHKGMPLLDTASRMNFLAKQVLTARNVKSHPVTDFWYGGLNYQIEHHLFPTMPRNKLREAQHHVKVFCQERGIAFHETGVLQSYAEIAAYLHEVSAPLREQTA
jgi:fatty acid desaturase